MSFETIVFIPSVESDLESVLEATLAEHGSLTLHRNWDQQCVFRVFNLKSYKQESTFLIYFFSIIFANNWRKIKILHYGRGFLIYHCKALGRI